MFPLPMFPLKDVSERPVQGRPFGGRLTLALCAALTTLAAGWPAAAVAEASPPMEARPVVEAGTHTLGGVRAGAAVLKVTTLADDGPGSLREALNGSEPRLIIFEVSGTIRAERDLIVRHPMVTVAGHTAPAPGITITGATIRVRSHDVVLQHLAIRPGAAATPKANAVRDGIDIGSGPHAPPVHNVLIENVSVSWAVDELVSVWGPGTHSVSIRHSILAEALSRAGHPEGQHSMGMLIRGHAEGVLVAGNLFASNNARNPVLARGASAVIANNLIFNPGADAIHLYSVGVNHKVTRASIVANVVDRGPDTAKGQVPIGFPVSKARHGAADRFGGQVFARVHIDDMSGTMMAGGRSANAEGDVYRQSDTPPVQAIDWRVSDGAQTRTRVTLHAGARPRFRDRVDGRILEGVHSGTGRIVDTPPRLSRKTGAILDRTGNVPTRKVALRRIRARDVYAVRLWLCQSHWTLGGAFTAQCPAEPSGMLGPV